MNALMEDSDVQVILLVVVVLVISFLCGLADRRAEWGEHHPTEDRSSARQPPAQLTEDDPAWDRWRQDH